ncbi:putative two-component system sensor kinase [Actinacidiphila reveromycinica]|uniref:histidine kinase n=1 Tax=Actinacidiphila reveromycinica TaxID=659352 RepID=A0A7U3UXU3_9ACTN|nr:histidine kinase [Streptomyces sp. SN-593]BBB00710.1 putative two-component system sensor kinase [Streptomyces sp. SN-593]
MNTWTSWPSREALSREMRPRARRRVGRGIRLALTGAALWGIIAKGELRPWASAGACLGVLVLYGVLWCYFRTTLRHRLGPALGMVALLVAGGALAVGADAPFAAVMLWCGCAVLALERLPMTVGLPVAVVALTLFVLFARSDSWLVTLLTALGVCLAGYTVRLDAEARGNTHRLLAQERAARKAEAETAALAERARIAREIHDVLAHSLSAQTVHLEAARLLVERGAERELVLERVVAARRMAREGLAETRQALSALRGDMTAVEDFLRELVASQGARLEVDGEPRRLPAEAGLAVRRVAQEAMTNVRKHAPGADVVLRLEYRPDEVELEFRDFGGRSPVDNSLGVSGSGYGLRGMRERAELLGGALDAGPAEEGFVVRLRVPA